MGPLRPCRADAGRRYDGLEVAHIVARHGAVARARWRFTDAQLRVMRRLVACRTPALGGHLDVCDHCGLVKPSYNSCRDRHCPKCQAARQARWVALRSARVLPTPHYHVVFTLPGLLRPLVKADRRGLFDLLFRAAANTLAAFAADETWLGAQLGVTAVLHTWTRDLRFHPHLHCVVTAGGLSADGERWIQHRRHKRFLFPVAALAKVFRGKLLGGIVQRRQRGELVLDRRTSYLADTANFQRLLDRLYRKRWCVYAKRPFAGVGHVFAYLGRYTHRVAISNQRLVALDDDGVHFVTRDGEVACLDPAEFVRRFVDHVLPHRFVKIRHYGLYASSNVRGRLERARALIPTERSNTTTSTSVPSADELATLDARQLLLVLAGVDVLRCPECGRGTLVTVATIPAIRKLPRGPP